MPASKIEDFNDFLDQAVNDVILAAAEAGISAPEVLDALDAAIQKARQELADDEYAIANMTRRAY